MFLNDNCWLGHFDPRGHQRNLYFLITAQAPPGENFKKKYHVKVKSTLDKVTRFHKIIARIDTALHIAKYRLGRIDPRWCLRVNFSTLGSKLNSLWVDRCLRNKAIFYLKTGVNTETR